MQEISNLVFIKYENNNKEKKDTKIHREYKIK